MRSEKGSLSILLAGYLALAVLIGVSVGAVGLSLIAKNRTQAVADSAILYAHDRSVRKGVPNLSKLQIEVQRFLETAPSAAELEISSAQVTVKGDRSFIELCARFIDPLGVAINSGLVCRTASAKSYLVD